MKKSIKIALVSVTAVIWLVVILFFVIPFATSKTAEQKFSEALSEAGIPEDVWRAGKITYIPIFGYIVIDDLEFGEKGSAGSVVAKKVILTLNTKNEPLIAGSVDVRDVKFSLDDSGITIKTFSVKNFSLDKKQFMHSPIEAVKKLDSIQMSDAVFKQREKTFFSLGKFNADLGYTEGKIPIPSSISLKNFVIDLRQFLSFPALRPEYRLSNMELKNSVSGSNYKVDLVIDAANLFAIKSNLGISIPGELSMLSGIDFDEDIKLNSILLTLTDKSLLDHIFELMGIPDGRTKIAEELRDTFITFASMGGIETERFATEAVNFIAKPGKLEIKTNLNSPISFEDIKQNPLAINLSLAINGGKPFVTSNN